MDIPEQNQSRCPIDIINRRGHLQGYDLGLNPEDGELLRGNIGNKEGVLAKST